MPVVQDHFIAHQWLRELRRSGARVLVGVYFRMRSEEAVWAGRYNEPHREMPLGQAIRELKAFCDPLGFEIFVDKKIEVSAITRIRHLPQKIGWRVSRLPAQGLVQIAADSRKIRPRTHSRTV
jgi:hypothetical protein